MTEATGEAKVPYSRWTEIVLPLLRYIAQHESSSRDKPRIHENAQTAVKLAIEMGLEDRKNEVADEMYRLVDEGYVNYQDVTLTPWGYGYFGLSLTGKGARKIRLWPPDDLVDALQAYIDLQIEQAESDEERQRWKRFKQFMADLTPPLVGEAIKWVISAAG